MADLALLIGPGDVITLSGDLGAGKTAAARAMIRYLAGDDALEVPSPTFTLVQAYDLPPFPLLHADLYRDQRCQRTGRDRPVAIAGGHGGADRMAGARAIALPPTASTSRSAIVRRWDRPRAPPRSPATARPPRRSHGSRRCGNSSTEAGFGEARRRRMAGDASTRSYARLIRDDGAFILMNSPRRPDGPAIYDGKSYSAAVHLAEDVKPFVAIAGGLRERGFSAPAIHHADLDARIPDHRGFRQRGLRRGRSAAADRRSAMRPRPTCWRRCTASRCPRSCRWRRRSPTPFPTFDTDALLVEIGLMLEWYLPDRGAPPSDDLRAEFVAMWRDLLRKPAAAAKTWVLRDFHSPNLIWLGERDGIARVGIIDFQDAVLGPAAYDLVSLLQDARIDVPEAARACAADALHQGAARGRRQLRSGRFRRALRDHVGAAQHAAARHLRPAQPARRQAAISAPSAPDLDLSQPLAGPPGAGAGPGVVCRQRPASRFREFTAC